MNSVMQIKSVKHKYALLLMAAVAMTATGAMAQALPNQPMTEWMGIKSEYRAPESILVTPTNVGGTQMPMAPQTCIV